VAPPSTSSCRSTILPPPVSRFSCAFDLCRICNYPPSSRPTGCLFWPRLSA
jgi:hypothetical protein